eukprot:2603218-Rhodomonas_salina.1
MLLQNHDAPSGFTPLSQNLKAVTALRQRRLRGSGSAQAWGLAAAVPGHHCDWHGVCGMHGRMAWQRGHESVVQTRTWAEIAKDTGVLVDTVTRQGHLPRPVHTRTDQRGDIKFNLRGTNVTGAVGYISITHVAQGSGPRLEEWGSYKPAARLADRVGSKNRTYTLFDRDQNLEFLALVGTTRGPQDRGVCPRRSRVGPPTILPRTGTICSVGTRGSIVGRWVVA